MDGAGCLQTASDVIVQKSTREGFGLVMTKVLWKGEAVAGGDVGGVELQTNCEWKGLAFQLWPGLESERFACEVYGCPE